jgi:hypothetical protein
VYSLLSFFPPCYEDELLYSVFARYHQRSGNLSFKSTLVDLFNTDSIKAVTDFSSGLGVLTQKIEPLYNFKYFIENHTLVPYYRPFMEAKIYNNTINLMNSSNANGVHISMGIIQSSISFPKYLRFCTECYKLDQLKYGESYWHRCHQLPGVVVCPFHGNILMNSNIPFKQQENTQHFYALSHTLIENCNAVDYLKNNIEVFTFISNETKNLLQSEIFPIGLNKLKKLYLYFLGEKNLITSSGRVKFRELLPAFINLFGVDLLEYLNCGLTVDQEDTWLHKVLRKPRVSCHPLRHLLLLYFFMRDIKSYSYIENTNYLDIPFGPPMYPCLNKAADHYRERVISDLKITRCSKTGKPIGTFTCVCGFVYSRSGPDNTIEDKFRIGKVKEFGHVWKQKLKELSNKGLTKYRIAQELEVDFNTIKKYLEVEISKGQNQQTNIEMKDEKNKTSKKEEYRNRWIEHRNLHSNKNRTELRRGSPNVYIWLYRNDNDWLYENLPPKESATSTNKRVNWEERDYEIARLIKIEVDKIMAVDPPERVTVSRIGQRIQKLALLEKKLNKLPRSKKILEELMETVEDFQKRRIKSIAAKKREANKEIKEWELIREAGIRPEYIELMNQTLQNEINF